MSKRRSTRTAQLQPLTQPQPTHSDYETDQPDITNTVAPPLQRTDAELNLTVLRRAYDRSVTAILAQAAFAVVYTFSSTSQQWDKHGVEGTLFVCHHAVHSTTAPRFSVVILNRKRLDTFSVELSHVEDVETTEEYVILSVAGSKEGEPETYGLWMYNQEEGQSTGSTKDEMARFVQACMMAGKEAKVAEEEVRQEDDEYTYGGNVEEIATTGYGMDGTTQMQQQMGEEEAIAQQAGQRLDLLDLFSNNNNNNINQYRNDFPSSNHHQAQPTLASPMETFTQPHRHAPSGVQDGFPTIPEPMYQGAPPLHSPFQPQPQQPLHQPSQQQNTLLNLFRSAR